MENLGINKFKNLMEEKLNSSVDALKTKAEELGESSKNEEYVDKNEVEYEEEYSDNEYDEEEYQEDEEYDEEYDGEEYEDEDDGEHLSRAELELISTDYTEMVSEDSIEELEFLLNSYFKIKKIDPYTEEEKELKSYSEEVIRAILLEYEIPIDDLFYLFRFILTLESFYEDKSVFSNNKKDIIFTEIDTETGLKTLKLRLDEYLAEYPDLFEDLEVYQHIFELDKSFTKLPTYNAVVERFYSVLISNPSAGTFEYLIELYNQNAYKAEEYLGKMAIPEANAEELATSFNLILNSKKSSSVLKNKLEEIKSIISAKFPEDEKLKSLLDNLDAQETAKKYKKIKFASLGVAIFLFLVAWYIGIVFLIAWGVLFFTPVHDKIPFLAKGRECYKATKK